MAISFSRPDPASPNSVSAASFPVTRRGFDQGEVRDFLRMVAAELSRHLERERFLESELRNIQTNGLSGPGRLDEETVTALLGEETARVLTAAREASTHIRERAEESASRLVKDAADEAVRIRESAGLEAQRVRDDAAADAEAEVEMAKQQGRDMVNEARAYREKVLSELSRRRDAANNQIEKLLHGRDRLLGAFERARIAAESVLEGLHDAHDEPETIINLAPVTGPVPVINPKHPVVGRAFDHEAAEAAEALHRAAEEAAALIDGTSAFDIPLDGPAAGEAGADEATPEAEPAGIHLVVEEDAEVPAEAAAEVGEVETADSAEVVVTDDVEESGETEQPGETVTNVVSIFDRRPVPAPVAQVDDIFARLRAGSTDSVAKAAAEAPEVAVTAPEAPEKPAKKAKAKPVEPAVDPARFFARDEAISPVVPQVARKLKRVLADEQNNVLEHLRKKKSSLDLDAFLGTVEEHVAKYAASVSEETMAAASAGAKSMKDARGSSRRVTNKAVASATLEIVASGLVSALREDLRVAVGEADGDRSVLADLVRDVYRTWKMTGIDSHVDDIACAAFNTGAYLSLEPTASVCWLVDPSSPCCGDCDDNALAGAVSKGEAFPTGALRPMGHAGCRCLVGPAAR